MSQGNIFFFILSSTLLFTITFIMGLTVIPLICGLRYICIRAKAPSAPVKPTDPTKPKKPTEPKMGASADEWATYRKTLSAYREKKDKWKEDHRYFKENESKLLLEYEKGQRSHSKRVTDYQEKVVKPARVRICNYCKCFTTQVMFCMTEVPEMAKCLLRAHYGNDTDLLKV